jgi:putative membrane protein
VTPFDPGLQPERTALAWRRAALSLAIGSLAAGRLLQPVLGAGAWVLAAAGVALGFGLLIAGHRRTVVVDRVLHADGDLAAGPGAGLLAVLAAVAVLVGGVGLVMVARS